MQPQNSRYKCVDFFELDKIIKDVEAIPTTTTTKKYWSYSNPGVQLNIYSIKNDIKWVLNSLVDNKTKAFNIAKSKLLNSRDTYDIIEPIVKKLFNSDNPYIVSQPKQRESIDSISSKLKQAEYVIYICHDRYKLLAISNFGSIWLNGIFYHSDKSERILSGQYALPDVHIDCIITTAETLYNDSVDIEKIANAMKSSINKILESIKTASINSGKSKDDCAVCYTFIKQRMVISPCNHAQICGLCLSKITVCPICNKNIESKFSIFL